MKVNYLNAIGFACLLSLSACASISMTRDLALKTLSEKSATDYFLYVDSPPTNPIAQALVVAYLETSSTPTSDGLVKLLRTNKNIGVAGSYDNITAATVKRAIKDFGTTVPFKAKLVMVGEPKNFVDLVDFANTKGLTIKVLSPN